MSQASCSPSPRFKAAAGERAEQSYFLVAKLDLVQIRGQLLSEPAAQAVRPVPGGADRQGDQAAAARFGLRGQRAAGRRGVSATRGRFAPSNLYAWNLRLAPSRKRACARRRDHLEWQKVIQPAVRAAVHGDHRRRHGHRAAVGGGRAAGLAPEERLHRQRVARAEDAAVADPHVRRDGGHRAAQGRGDRPRIRRHHHPRVRAAVAPDRQRAGLRPAGTGQGQLRLRRERPGRGAGAGAGRQPLPPGQGAHQAAHPGRSATCRWCAWTKTP